MKNSWVIGVLLPILGFSFSEGDDFFYFNDGDDEALCHYAYEEEADFENSLADTAGSLEKEEFDSETLSLFQSDLEAREQLPWDEEMSTSEITSYVEKRARQMSPDYDDVFAYEAPSYGDKKGYEPSAERVPEDSRHFFGRPRVVQSKPDSESQKSSEHQLNKKGRIAQRKGERHRAQPKTVAKSD